MSSDRKCVSCGHRESTHDDTECVVIGCDCVGFVDAEIAQAKATERIAVALESIARDLAMASRRG